MTDRMHISVEIGDHNETDGLKELLSAVKMTHDECKGGKVEPTWKKDNNIVFTCTKCGISLSTEVPDTSEYNYRANKISLANFLAGTFVPKAGILFVTVLSAGGYHDDCIVLKIMGPETLDNGPPKNSEKSIWSKLFT